MDHPFLRKAAQIFNAGLSRSLVLYGNIYDSFSTAKEQGEVSLDLVDLIKQSWDLPQVVIITYELNGPIAFQREQDRHILIQAWDQWNRSAIDFVGTERMPRQELAKKLQRCVGRPTMALELLRQVFYMIRELREQNYSPLKGRQLLLVVESADLLMPRGQGDISALPMDDRQRLMILHDWFSDPSFTRGEDNVVLLSETSQGIHSKITSLPQVQTLQVPLPSLEQRRAFWDRHSDGEHFKEASVREQLVQDTAGLSQHALEQLVLSSNYFKRAISPEDLHALIQQRIEESLGPDVVEFKRPKHRLSDLVGNRDLLGFIEKRLIPRLKTSDPKRALPGFAVAGPIRGGKTYIFEAVAAELGIPVLILKGIRSQWFGQTDVIVEKLTSLLTSLGKAMIFVDEADTQFGKLDGGSHETEKRLTGKFQQIMSDPSLKGKLIWVLVTARIDKLSPDIRGPGRAGGLIIPVLDPSGQDLVDYAQWMCFDVLGRSLSEEELATVLDALGTSKTYAGAIMALKAEFKDELSFCEGEYLNMENICEIIHRYLPPPIEKTRREQTLLALLNCTRLDLIPPSEADGIQERREAWQRELAQLQSERVY